MSAVKCVFICDAVCFFLALVRGADFGGYGLDRGLVIRDICFVFFCLSVFRSSQRYIFYFPMICFS